MLNQQKYERIEAIEDLLDDYDLLIATIDAQISFRNRSARSVQEKIKKKKTANEKASGYLLLMKMKSDIHINELKKLTYLHYQEGLNEKLNMLKKSKS